MNRLSGRVWRYGDDVNTDVIFPGKYTYTASGREEIAAHALEDLDPSFVGAVQPGDLIVAGKNWGCGSSREQAATCLVYSGISAVVAASFGRIFYRNAINNGLLVIECPAAVAVIETGATVTVDLDHAAVEVEGRLYPFSPLPQRIRLIVEAGGLVPYVQRSLTP